MSLAWFLGGTLFGSVGFKILGSKDAKKVYSNAVSYALDAKDYVMETAENLRESWDDIYSEAKDLKEKRDGEKKKEEEDKVILDKSEDVKKRKSSSAKRKEKNE